MYGHNYAGSIGYFKSPLCRHIALTHNYKFKGFGFFPLERIQLPSSGGDSDGTILYVETKWIFRLRAYLSPGLNEKFLTNRSYRLFPTLAHYICTCVCVCVCVYRYACTCRYIPLFISSSLLPVFPFYFLFCFCFWISVTCAYPYLPFLLGPSAVSACKGPY